MWKNKDAGEFPPTTVNKQEVCERLFQELSILRDYWQLELLEEGYQTKRHSAYWLSGIVVSLASIIEQIHQTPNNNKKALNLSQRRDYLGKYLYRQRNHAAHYNRHSRVKEEQVMLFIKALCCYLLIAPCLDLERTFNNSNNLNQIISNSKECQKIIQEYFS